MKVLYISPSIRGGMKHYSIQFINHISNEIDARLITGISTENHNYDNSILKYEISFDKFNFFKTSYGIYKFIKEFNPDLIHFLDFHYYFLLLMPYIKLFPIAITAHDVQIHPGNDNFINKLLLKFYLSCGEIIFVHGSEMKKKLIIKGFDEKKIFIIPHGDYAFFLRYPVIPYADEENEVLFFGRIQEYKGLKYLLEALPKIRDSMPNIRIIIAGEGDLTIYRNYINYNKKYLEIHNYFISDNEIPKFFQRAKIIVLPYIEASQSGIIPIAYAFKKPVIASKVGCIPDVVEDGITGYLIEPANPDQLANSIIKLLNNDRLRKQMGEQGYIKMKNELSWVKVILLTKLAYKTFGKIR